MNLYEYKHINEYLYIAYCKFEYRFNKKRTYQEKLILTMDNVY